MSLLWETNNIVLSFFKEFIDDIIFFSVAWSNALVASSKIRIDGLLYNALAIEILCFCPPEIFIPFSPILEFRPSSNWEIKSFNWAFSIASLRLSWSISSSLIPNAMFFLRESSIK